MTKVIYTILSIIFISTSLVGAELNYPYIATEKRVELIKNQYTNIEIGNSIQEVLGILPVPDEVRDLYEPKKYKAKIIGSTYWYIMQRKAKLGSVNEKDEKLVRVSFDLNGEVTHIDKWGF
jgi:hypothetical protein